MWSRILALIVKEFLVLLRDKRGRMVLILPPLIQTMVLSYAATFDVWNIRLAVLNEDPGPAGRELVARFTASPNFETVKLLTHVGQVRATISSRESLMVLHIPETFGRDLLIATEGRDRPPARVQIIVDGRQSNTAQIALGYARNIVNGYATEVARRYGLSGLPASLVVRAWFNPNLESQWFIVPGIIANIVLIVATMVTALSVARERELGTFDQLLVTPLRPLEILLGKTLPALAIGLLEGAAILLIAIYWFQVPLNGSVVVIFGGLFFFVLAGIGVGLMISSLANTQQQAILGVFIFLFPAITLSGFATPIQNMEPWVQQLTYLNPLRYIMIIMRGQFLEAMPFEMVVTHVWPLLVITAVSMAVAVWMFRHRLQ